VSLLRRSGAEQRDPTSPTNNEPPYLQLLQNRHHESPPPLDPSVITGSLLKSLTSTALDLSSPAAILAARCSSSGASWNLRMRAAMRGSRTTSSSQTRSRSSGRGFLVDLCQFDSSVWRRVCCSQVDDNGAAVALGGRASSVCGVMDEEEGWSGSLVLELAEGWWYGLLRPRTMAAVWRPVESARWRWVRKW
jgi:hypothetical protein